MASNSSQINAYVSIFQPVMISGLSAFIIFTNVHMALTIIDWQRP